MRARWVGQARGPTEPGTVCPWPHFSGVTMGFCVLLPTIASLGRLFAECRHRPSCPTFLPYRGSYPDVVYLRRLPPPPTRAGTPRQAAAFVVL